MNIEVIIAEFDRLYVENLSKYNQEVSDFKAMGYKIYRNDAGKHKVVEPVRQNNDIYSQMGMYGDVFKDIFGGVFGG